ncbi:MAG TPA: thioesterase family protein [Stellaceae bacterium]|nr:thioesterase family protein [Stellaceae bacterium]
MSIETHRSMVKAWECDSFGHFTVAYYFDRFADASATLRERLGIERARPVRYLARFIAELRAGEAFHVESGIVAAKGSELRVGHRLLNSATGKLCTTVEERVELPAGASRPSGPMIELERAKDDPGFADEMSAGLIAGARDRVRASEIDTQGELSLASYVHRSSIGSIHLLAAMGLTPDYLREARRGFSTFEIALRLDLPRPKAGEPLAVSSGLMQLGSSSIRMVHRIAEARSGRRVATLRQSGVHFDLVARRSAPIPQELRTKAAALVMRAS